MPAHHKPNKIIVEGDIARMFLTRRDGTIIETIFDAEDVLKVQSHPYRWGVHYERRIGNFYVVSVIRDGNKYRQVRLHRFITNCPEGYVPDHINHNTLDNRKSNLRIVPQAVNLQNKNGAYKSSKSGVRGVYWHKVTGKWYARVCLNGKEVYGELFANFEDACRAVNEARKRIYENKEAV